MMQIVTTIILISVTQYECLYAASELNDFNYVSKPQIPESLNNVSNSCMFGVKSVSMVLFTSDIPQGTFVEINELCDFIDPSKPVFFMTHGFLSYSHTSNLFSLASLLLKRGFTIFSLNWANAACYNDPKFINLFEYPFAVSNTRKVGDHLASYIKSVIDTCGVSIKDIILMGHSLGAHISGFAAKNIQKSDYGKIQLLIGTDPANPLFMFRNCEDRFCVTDAERVVALHTSTLGIQKSIAHLDLWFNGGLIQPACGFFGFNVNCSHNIAVNYLAHTLLDNCVYFAVPISRKLPTQYLMPGCSSSGADFIVDNKIFDSKDSIKGDYCVSVTSEYPYCTKNDFSYQK